MAQLQAGGASRDITPDRDLPHYYGSTLHRGDGCPLTVNAVCLRCGDIEAALVSIDTLFVDRPHVLAMREEIALATGIPGENLCLAATHSHSTPTLGPSFIVGEQADPVYLDQVSAGVRAAVVAAQEALRPAKLFAGNCPTPGIEFCRRVLRPDGQAVIGPQAAGHPDWTPEGQPDRTMAWAMLERADGQALATIFAWPVHNNACTDGWYDADLFGWAREAMRGRLGAQATVVTFAAPAGDVIWFDPVQDDFPRGDDFARDVGEVLAGRIMDARAAAAPMAVTRLRVGRDLRAIPDRAWEDSTWCEDDCRGSSERARVWARERYDPESEAVRSRGATECVVEVQGFGLGDFAIVTNPAELFCEFGTRIRAGSPCAVTMPVELANGACGYVPYARSFDHGGYETHRTCWTSRLIPEAGEIITRHSLELLERLRR